ncbi:MAG: tRNA (guanosine(37)-N1)-methyltransferase TrmD [Cardiobacteriaceae bacterium]|nr:tRNA (guanosine(37)-N1)-methyltransferase TrmD [Cardiobacteriaceae bacterium]
MKIDVISLFPELVQHWFSQGVVGRAIKQHSHTHIFYHNPRHFSDDKHGRCDDRPFGGGSGMLMEYTPLSRIAEQLNQQPERPFHIYLSPQGIPFHHNIAKALSEKPRLALWCGRYEGVDQRFIDQHIDLELSLGDFVLSGGEIAAAVVIDSTLRLLDGVLGNENSAKEDSFHNQLLDCPHYTRPEVVDTMRVPDVLLSGHHGNIARWRLKQSLGQTFLRRPDIFTKLHLSSAQTALLNEFLQEINHE